MSVSIESCSNGILLVKNQEPKRGLRKFVKASSQTRILPKQSCATNWRSALQAGSVVDYLNHEDKSWNPVKLVGISKSGDVTICTDDDQKGKEEQISVFSSSISFFGIHDSDTSSKHAEMEPEFDEFLELDTSSLPMLLGKSSSISDGTSSKLTELKHFAEGLTTDFLSLSDDDLLEKITSFCSGLTKDNWITELENSTLDVVLKQFLIFLGQIISSLQVLEQTQKRRLTDLIHSKTSQNKIFPLCLGVILSLCQKAFMSSPQIFNSFEKNGLGFGLAKIILDIIQINSETIQDDMFLSELSLIMFLTQCLVSSGCQLHALKIQLLILQNIRTSITLTQTSQIDSMNSKLVSFRDKFIDLVENQPLVHASSVSDDQRGELLQTILDISATFQLDRQSHFLEAWRDVFTEVLSLDAADIQSISSSDLEARYSLFMDCLCGCDVQQADEDVTQGKGSTQIAFLSSISTEFSGWSEELVVSIFGNLPTLLKMTRSYRNSEVKMKAVDILLGTNKMELMLKKLKKLLKMFSGIMDVVAGVLDLMIVTPEEIECLPSLVSAIQAVIKIVKIRQNQILKLHFKKIEKVLRHFVALQSTLEGDKEGHQAFKQSAENFILALLPLFLKDKTTFKKLCGQILACFVSIGSEADQFVQDLTQFTARNPKIMAIYTSLMVNSLKKNHFAVLSLLRVIPVNLYGKTLADSVPFLIQQIKDVSEEESKNSLENLQNMISLISENQPKCLENQIEELCELFFRSDSNRYEHLHNTFKYYALFDAQPFQKYIDDIERMIRDTKYASSLSQVLSGLAQMDETYCERSMKILRIFIESDHDTTRFLFLQEMLKASKSHPECLKPYIKIFQKLRASSPKYIQSTLQNLIDYANSKETPETRNLFSHLEKSQKQLRTAQPKDEIKQDTSLLNQELQTSKVLLKALNSDETTEQQNIQKSRWYLGEHFQLHAWDYLGLTQTSGSPSPTKARTVSPISQPTQSVSPETKLKVTEKMSEKPKTEKKTIKLKLHPADGMKKSEERMRKKLQKEKQKRQEQEKSDKEKQKLAQTQKKEEEDKRKREEEAALKKAEELRAKEEAEKAIMRKNPWREALDKRSGKKYWYHFETKETTWIDPAAVERSKEAQKRKNEEQRLQDLQDAQKRAELLKQKDLEQRKESEKLEKEQPWAKTDDPKTGRPYWYHRETKKTTWINPYLSPEEQKKEKQRLKKEARERRKAKEKEEADGLVKLVLKKKVDIEIPKRKAKQAGFGGSRRETVNAPEKRNGEANTAESNVSEPVDAEKQIEGKSAEAKDDPTAAGGEKTTDDPNADKISSPPTPIPVAPTSVPDAPTSVPDAPTSVPDAPISVPDAPTSAPDAPMSIPGAPTSAPEPPGPPKSVPEPPGPPKPVPEPPLSVPSAPDSAPEPLDPHKESSKPPLHPEIELNTRLSRDRNFSELSRSSIEKKPSDKIHKKSKSMELAESAMKRRVKSEHVRRRVPSILRQSRSLSRIERQRLASKNMKKKHERNRDTIHDLMEIGKKAVQDIRRNSAETDDGTKDEIKDNPKDKLIDKPKDKPKGIKELQFSTKTIGIFFGDNGIIKGCQRASQAHQFGVTKEWTIVSINDEAVGESRADIIGQIELAKISGSVDITFRVPEGSGPKRQSPALTRRRQPSKTIDDYMSIGQQIILQKKSADA